MRKIFLMLFASFVFVFGAVLEEIEIEGTDGGNDQSVSYQFLSQNGVDVPNIFVMASKCYKENSIIVRDYLVQAFNTNPTDVSEQELANVIKAEVIKRKDFLPFIGHYCLTTDGFSRMDEEMFSLHDAAVKAGDNQSVADLENSLITILADALVNESITVDGPFKIKE